MHPIRSYIHQYATLADHEWDEIFESLRFQLVPKGTTILTEGQICRSLYFITSGMMRYYVVKDGEEVTKFFTEPPYCFTSQRSFTQREPARENIDTIQDSELWEMSHTAAFDLLRIPGWNTFVRKLTQEVQYFTELILEDIQTKTAEERYVEWVENKHPFLKEVPLKHLASYLGIAPQSLSRIRKKYALSQKT